MSTSWLGQEERGSQKLLNFYVWLSLRSGRGFARALLYPIAFYFVVFSRRAHKASQDYLTRALGRKASWRDIFRHYLTFSTTIHDRVYFLTNGFNRFRIEVHGSDVFRELIAERRGCLLLGSHFGSFEVARVLGVREQSLPIKVLNFPENSKRINAVWGKLNPELMSLFIDLGTPTAMLEVAEHIRGGGMVGILGDRTVQAGKQVPIDFLGAPALFPLGPMQLAVILKVPVVLFFGIYRGSNRYDVYFEKLTERVGGGRRGGGEMDIEQAIAAYAKRLEHFCRDAPYNWFNFYDFWGGTGDVS